MNENKSLTGYLLSKTIEEFISESKELSLDQVKSLSNHLKVEYERVKRTKEALVEMSPEGSEETLNNLYVIMQLIEDRVTILQEIEDERSIS